MIISVEKQGEYWRVIYTVNGNIRESLSLGSRMDAIRAVEFSIKEAVKL